MRTLIALMLFATTPVVAGDWEDGRAAFRAGDHQKAVRLWKPLAEQGDARAQAMLGGMYHKGRGVSPKTMPRRFTGTPRRRNRGLRRRSSILV